MEMVTLTIDGIKVEVSKDATVLEAARKAGIKIPTLCFLKGVNEIGACRMCVVEVKGARALQTSVFCRFQKVWRLLPIPRLLESPGK